MTLESLIVEIGDELARTFAAVKPSPAARIARNSWRVPLA
jgi:hypothetical protein